MSKIRKIFPIFLIFLFTFLAAFFAKSYFNPKKAGINIQTTPVSMVFIDGVQVGKTPYDTIRKPGEITLKLVPETIDKPLATFETKISLGSGIKTFVKREFGESDEVSSGEIISFEKTGSNEASLAIISRPESAQVDIDGLARGFAPYKTSSIMPGEHQIAISVQGYNQRNITVRTLAGYKLTAEIKLSPNLEAQKEKIKEEEIKEPEKKIFVEILNTPSGFLRVRSEAKTSSTELARVKPGEKYLFLEEDKDTGWFKIEYEKGNEGGSAKEGWVSNEFSKKVEETVAATPTP